MRREELKLSGLQNETLLESLQVGVAIEKEGRIVWANRRLHAALGFAPEEMAGTGMRMLFRSEEDHATATGLHYRPEANADLALQRQDGSPAWCRITVNPVDPANPGEGRLWSFADISDLMEAEQHARDIEQDLGKTLTKHEAILRSLQAGVLLVKDRIVIWGNQRLFSILGFAPEELVGQSVRAYFCNDADYKSIDTEGYPLLRAGQPFGKEIQLLRGDGRKIWCHIIGNAVDLNDLSEGFIWSFADITDRVEAEHQMREAQDKLAQMLARQDAILRSMQVGVMLAKDRKVAWANQRFFDMLGFMPEELLDQSTRVYFRSEEDYTSIDRQGYPLLREGKPFVTELALQRKDGSQLWCAITGNAVDLNDFSAGFIWSFADINDRVEAEARAQESIKREQLMEAEKMAALGMVVAGVAHEINTPIGVSYTLVTHFKGKTREFLDVFGNGTMKKSDLQKYVELAGETANQLNTNITRAAELIQSFKQVAVDQSRDDQRSFELKSYLQEVVTSLTPTLRKTLHRIEVDCEEGILMDSYPGALSQVITNLIMNAMVHAFEGDQAGTMRIEAQGVDKRVRLRFKDDGKGIPAENLPRIFDPFFTTRRGSGGSGLGLNIVFNLVTRKLQGHISCRSILDKGATFDIEFPCTVDPEK